MSENSLLPIALAAAVPLWVHQLQGEPWGSIQPRLNELSTVLVEQGDLLFYRSAKPGGTAKVFNALAESIAILSFAPGGVEAFGQHWEAKHPEGK